MHRTVLVVMLVCGCTNPQEPSNTTDGDSENEGSTTSGPTSATTTPASTTVAMSTTGEEPTGTSSGTSGDPSTGESDATSSSSSGGSSGDSSSDSSSGGAQGAFLYEDFDNPNHLDNWFLREEVEGTEAQWTVLDFDVTNPDSMTLIPETSGWFADYDGPFVFTLVSGDFMMETYVTVTGLADPSGPPTQTYNSGGIMLRDPANEPMGEDWVVHNTGFQEFGVESEAKLTIDSNSFLTTSPGTNEGLLRICRFAGEIAVVRKLEGDADWVDTEVPYVDMLPDEVQAGMAVTAWNSTGNDPAFNEDPDMIAIWDYVAFYEMENMSQCYED